jgi:PatG C-terminal/PatG Domain
MDIANLAKLRATLITPENRYLVRELCWVLAVDGIDSYVLAPSDPTDILLLAEAIRPSSSSDHIDAAIGRIVNPLPADALCSQVPLPLLAFDQLHSFDSKSFAKGIKKADGQEVDESFVVDVLQSLPSLGSGLGLVAEHRALNYVTLRYPMLYHLASKKASEGFSLQAVRFLRSPVAGGRILVDVLFTFISSVDSRAERWSVKVDVTDKYPFLRGALSPHLLTH